MKLLDVTPTCWRNAGVTPVSRNFSAWRTWAYMGVHGRILQASCPRPLKCRVGAAAYNDDDLTEHLEMPSSFWRLTDTCVLYLDCARAPSHKYIIARPCQCSRPKDILATMKLATLLASLAAVTTSAFSPISTATQLQSFSRYAASASNSQLFAMPICIVVEAEIKEDRMDEFLDMIEKNAVGSREEPGCIRFGMY